MRQRSLAITWLCSGGALLTGAAPAAVAESGNFLLIRRGEPIRQVEVAEINHHRLVYREGHAGWVTLPRSDCVGLLNTDALVVTGRQAWLRLADGQVLPGEALSGARPTDGVLVWNQSTWLGRLKVPLERIESVSFVIEAEVPAASEQDVLVLANGDRLEGFVMALGDPITIEPLIGDAGGPDTIDLPLDRVAAVRMVTPAQKPAGRRLWLIDGTVYDVEEVTLGDDGFFHLEGLPFSDEQSKRIEAEGVAAVLLDQQGMVPFARLSPRRVKGPPTRYVVPAPHSLDDQASLGLSRVQFRGPVTVHYVLPAGATWLSAEAELPPLARAWGDCDLVIRCDDQEVYSQRLNATQPVVTIGVPLHGSVLTVEITEGSAGPIQDQVILHRAMILVN